MKKKPKKTTKNLYDFDYESKKKKDKKEESR